MELEQLQKLKAELEKKAMEKNEQCYILDIQYYKDITFDDIEGKTEPVFLVEKEVNGELKRELQKGDTVIADIGEDNTIYMRNISIGKEIMLLVKLRDTTPISLRELEEIERRKEARNHGTTQAKKQNKKDKEKKDTQEENIEESKPKEKSTNAKDIEIDIHSKVTETKTFADLVPEVKEKQLETVKIRRLDATRYEFYGETKDGEEVALESLTMTEGTNPNKEINQVGANGEVEEGTGSCIIQLTNGTNEQNGNEGFVIGRENGIAEVSYYRRSRDNEYTSVPVNLKTTNQKRTDKDVREYAEKTRNPDISDNIERANDRLERQEETTLENIDDDPYNDIPEVRWRI